MRIVDRILAISDIHGENTKFHKILKQVEYDPKSDLLVVCGDLIDRGEDNLAIIETCMKLQKQGAVMLKGNHEQFAQECIRDMICENPSQALQVWVNHNGGSNTYDELLLLSKNELKEILIFLETLPLYFASGEYIFAHAGANTRKPIEMNIEDELVWMENSFPYCPAYKNKTIIFGHTPTWLLHKYKAKEKAERKNTKIWFDPEWKDKIGIDCGSVFGGRMAMLELPSLREYYE